MHNSKEEGKEPKNAVAADLSDNDLAINDPEVVVKSKEDANLNMNVVDVNDEYWKENDSPTHEKCQPNNLFAFYKYDFKTKTIYI